MWYETLPPPSRSTLRDLISAKRFAFANGGWCMHDEANTHYVGMIDNTALGHRFLKEELGVVPSVGWQIDPFGHSSTQGGLMTGGVGFDALYFGR
jgi:alpha-mannosidase